MEFSAFPPSVSRDTLILDTSGMWFCFVVFHRIGSGLLKSSFIFHYGYVNFEQPLNTKYTNRAHPLGIENFQSQGCAHLF